MKQMVTAIIACSQTPHQLLNLFMTMALVTFRDMKLTECNETRGTERQALRKETRNEGQTQILHSCGRPIQERGRGTHEETGSRTVQ
jgi:hypothetical protein